MNEFEQLDAKLQRQIDAACDRYEAELHQGEQPAIRRFLTDVDNEIARRILFAELLVIDLDQNRHESRSMRFEKIRREFPEYTDALDSAINLDSSISLRNKGCEDTIAESDTTPAPLRSESDNDGKREIAQYELIEVVGAGAFGQVWKARDTKLDRVVAVKVPRTENLSAADPELDRAVAIKIPRQRQDAELFLKEAKSAAQLNHPNIVSVHEVGQDNETFFIVADLVDGEDLASWLSSNKSTIEDAVLFCQQVANALEHAHSVGVIHRDLKPANILLARGVGFQPAKETSQDSSQAGSLRHFQARITDFGLAKRDAGEITMTAPGKILGTPAYMSPEQAVGDGFQADARSDVYSLGVIMFELLTGEKPFRGTLQMLLKQVQEEEPPRLRRLNNRIPADLETITLKCLDKRPAARYQSAKELRDELQRFVEHKPITARPISTLGRGWRWCGRNPLVASLASLAALLLLCVAAVSTFGYLNQIEQTNILRRSQYGDQMKAAFAGADRFAEGRFVKQTLRKWHPQVAGEDLRGWEWYLLNSFFHRDVATLRGHQDTAEDVDWSSDGKLLTSVGGDGEIIIWDGTTHAAIHKKGLMSAYSPDGKRVLSMVGNSTGPESHVSVWNPESGEEELELDENPAFSAAWDPTGTYIASACTDGAARIWSSKTGDLVRTLRGHAGWVTVLAWAPDGKRLATASDLGLIKIWNPETSQEIVTLDSTVRDIMAGLRFSPDGRKLVTRGYFSQSTIRIWDASRGYDEADSPLNYDPEQKKPIVRMF